MNVVLLGHDETQLRIILRPTGTSQEPVDDFLRDGRLLQVLLERRFVRLVRCQGRQAEKPHEKAVLTAPSPVPERFEEEAAAIEAGRAGYVERIEADQLLGAAHDRDLLVRIERAPGQFVLADDAVLRIWPAHHLDEDLRTRFAQSFTVSLQRSHAQDVEYAVDQMVEIAVLALSPGINNVFTALMCLDRLAEGLSHFAERAVPAANRFDRDGRLRVVAESISFPKMLGVAFNQIRQNGCRSLAVMLRLLKAFQRIAEHTDELHSQSALREHADMVYCVLVEPASVLAKAWEHIRRIGERALWQPRRVLITGAGPVGLLAALMAVQQCYEVHVLDRVTEGPKPQLVRDLGASYHTGSVAEACDGADIVIECTGATRLIFDAMQSTAHNGIVCLTGMSSGGRNLSIDLGGLNREIVLENDVIFGSVNANRSHYEQAAEVLRQADRQWLERLITRRVPIERWQEAIERQPGDVKTVLAFA